MIYKNCIINIKPMHYNNTVEITVMGRQADDGEAKIIHQQNIESGVFLDNSSFNYVLGDIMIGKE